MLCCIFLNFSPLYLFSFVVTFFNVFYYSFSAKATLSRLLADDAATKKQLAQVKGWLGKMEGKEKEMLQ
jgi:hypothetical protein